MQPKAKPCANFSRTVQCLNPARAFHIFCDHCRIAFGGYSRENRKPQEATT